MASKVKESSESKKLNHNYYKSYWNENMINYLSLSAGSRWFDYLLSKMLAEVDSKSINTIADIGCGVGNKTAYMADFYKKAKVYGYDFSKEGIAAAKNIHTPTRKNLNFATEDITQSNHKKRFDLITAFDVLEHIDDWKGLTKDLIHVNTKYMLLSSPVGRMRPYEKHIGHVRNFKPHEIEKFMENNGYRTVKVFYAGFPFYSPILRDLTNARYNDYAELPQAKMNFASKRMHDIWYVLFRYFSMKSKGDIFVGLFERTEFNK
jgi:SAM-dependent methyltransferase